MKFRWTFFVMIVLFLIQQLPAQYAGVLSEIYFGRQPSARSEAMGRSLDLFSYDGNTSFFNPASCAGLHGLSFNSAYAEPYYTVEKAYYTNYGIAGSLGKYGILALNRFNWSFGENEYIVEVSGDDTGYYELNETLYTLNYACSIMENLFMGLNINLAQIRFNKTVNAWPIDLAVIKQFELMQDNTLKSRIALSAAFFNIFKAEIGETQKDELPQFMKLGLSACIDYRHNSLIPQLDLFNIIVNVQYHNLLNSSERKSIKTGAELALLQLFFYRIGYYRQTLDSYGSPDVNEDLFEEMTHGFGVQLPVRELGIMDWPLYIRFDYAKLEQPSYSKIITDWDDFKVWNINIIFNSDLFD